MRQTSVNTYVEGMNKDVDRGLISNKAYLEANNFRLVTTQGSTTGSLENIRGNKSIIPFADMMDEGDTYSNGVDYFVLAGEITDNGGAGTDYVAGEHFSMVGTAVAKTTGYTGVVRIIPSSYVIDDGQMIVGGIQMRDEIILFTTNNTSSSPTAGKSCIYKLIVDNEDEEQDSLTKIYDDNLNAGTNSTDFLTFSTYYPIKTISRYETDNIQKVYWVDGYNEIRYAIISNNLTIDGTAYSSNDYMPTDKFALTPDFTYTKPAITDIVSGTLLPGMIQYTYQLYTVNGSETAYSPLSDIIHITNSDDYAPDDSEYKGESDITVSTGKGLRININNNENPGYDRLRLVRIQYTAINETPNVNIVTEECINPEGESIDIIDTGDFISELTVAEVSLLISDFEKLIAQDLATKDNRLFAANISTDVFDIGTYDSRVVRYRDYTEPASGEDTIYKNTVDSDPSVSAGYIDDNSIQISISGWPTWAAVPTSRTVTDVDDVETSHLEIYYTIDSVQYHKWFTSGITTDNENYASTTLTFYVNTSVSIFGGSGVPDSIDSVDIASTMYHYDYTAPGTTTYETALIYDTGLGGDLEIEVPNDTNSLSSWNSAGWTNYTDEHDGINYYNDPDQFNKDSKLCVFQSDLSTVGAEGPNILIEVVTDTFVIDEAASADYTYYSDLEGTGENPSYQNYSSPFKTGKRSLQRGEVYRLFSTFYNEEGQASFPQWMCDLKMPEMNDTYGDTVTYELTTTSTGETVAKTLALEVTYRNFPTDAVAAQVFAVPRESGDRSILTQALVIPMTEVTSYFEPRTLGVALPNTETIIKLVSPEININQNLKFGSNDYLYDLGYFAEVTDGGIGANSRCIHKFQSHTVSTKGDNNVREVSAIRKVTPTAKDYYYTVGSYDCRNYSDTEEAYGSSGYIVEYNTTAWTAETNTRNLANYCRNVFDSQYGGNTYEARTRNYCTAISGLVTATGTPVTAYGDTFINFFDVNTLLYDTAQSGTDSLSEAVYVPCESSINCDLRHDSPMHVIRGTATYYYLIQEESGEWEEASSGNIYTQDTDAYQYNTVYSQIPNLDYKYAEPMDWSENMEFDTTIRSSDVKVNGETSDSWTNFPTNESIEVDSEYGPLNAIYTFNNDLYYFQDRGFGIVSVNPRSLIQDSNTTQLVLGTGGVLDRYDYISQHIGCKDKFSIVKSKSSLYWFDREGKSLYKLGEGLISLTRAKYMQSHMDYFYDSRLSIISAYDKNNDEILFTFFLDPINYDDSNYDRSYTLAFNELVGVFPSFYSIKPTLYIPYKNKLLVTTDDDGLTENTGDHLNVSRETLWFYDSENVDRCYFWSHDGSGLESDWFVDSNVEILFNPEYQFTKVFDNITFIANAWNRTLSGLTIQDNTSYDEFFDTMQFYNDYQNTGEVTLTYGTNLKRRERGWSTYIPRNIVDTAVTSNPNIYTATDTSRIFKERMRGKYLIGNFIYNNGTTHDKFVVSDMILHYRKSFR